MAKNFVFPPPPPPPPVFTPQPSFGSNQPPHQGQWASRGRGGFAFGPGRGSDSRRGNFGCRDDRSGYSYQQRNGFRDQTVRRDGQALAYEQNRQQHVSIQRPGDYVPSNGPNINPSQPSSIGRPLAYGAGRGSKRQHEQAFPRKLSGMKMQTAPAVPKFGLSLPTLVPSKPGFVKTVPSPPKQTNLLGLTPAEDDGEMSDEDEELKLAAAIAASGQEDALSFSYRGKLAVLKTREDIAAWVAERRRNFPTAARRVVMAKKKADEREKVVEAQQKAKKSLQEAKSSRRTGKQSLPQTKSAAKPIESQKTNDPVSLSSGITLSKEQLKIEKLRKAMEKNAKKIAKLEAATKESQVQSTNSTIDTKKSARVQKEKVALLDVNSSDEDSSTIASSSESEDTSSSGSSSNDGHDSDLDSEIENSDVFAKEHVDENQENSDSNSDVPQELASTRQAPIRVPPPVRKRFDTRPLCRNIKKFGKCSRTSCKYRHKAEDEADNDKSSKHEKKWPEKLSLYQRLLKQQIEEDEQEKARMKRQTSLQSNLSMQHS